MREVNHLDVYVSMRRQIGTLKLLLLYALQGSSLKMVHSNGIDVVVILLCNFYYANVENSESDMLTFSK